MTNASPSAPKLRAALDWWRNSARTTRPPAEADFVTEDPQRYGALLADAFIVDAADDGSLTFRFVGTELSDYIGWVVPGQRIDLAAPRRELGLIRDALARAVESLSPQLSRGRILAAEATGSGDFEAICLPLTTASGAIAFFGAVARDGLWRLPPAPQNHRAEIEVVLELAPNEADGRNGAAEGEPSQMTAGLSLFPRGA